MHVMNDFVRTYNYNRYLSIIIKKQNNPSVLLEYFSVYLVVKIDGLYKYFSEI